MQKKRKMIFFSRILTHPVILGEHSTHNSNMNGFTLFVSCQFVASLYFLVVSGVYFHDNSLGSATSGLVVITSVFEIITLLGAGFRDPCVGFGIPFVFAGNIAITVIYFIHFQYYQTNALYFYSVSCKVFDFLLSLLGGFLCLVIFCMPTKVSSPETLNSL